MNTQPNFETLKRLFYQAFVNSDQATTAILLQSLKGKLLPYYNTRYDEFKAEFNKWLDTIDIRQAGVLIDILKGRNVNLPAFLKYKQFYIDYNSNGALDLIKIRSLSPY